MKNILIIFLLTNLIASCNAQNTNNSEYVYSEDILSADKFIQLKDLNHIWIIDNMRKL